MSELKLKIDDTHHLLITHKDPEPDCCASCIDYDIDLIDQRENSSIRFGYAAIQDICYFLSEYERPRRLIDGNCVIDTKDLGIVWNKYTQDLIKDTDVLEKYHFVGNRHKQIAPYFNSWLYNDIDGKIILEITPSYPWFNKTKRTNPEKISCREWLKSYKSIIKIVIPKERLQEWIVQTATLKKNLMGF